MFEENEIIIRPAVESDYGRILELNEKDVAVLSPMDEQKLRLMEQCTEMFLVVEIEDDIAAFLMVMPEKSGYWGDNYRWFEEHYDRFLYVDRIVVDRRYRKHHLARRLYEKVIRYARERDIPCITAEVDIEPIYNEPSIRFHHTLGFREVGTKMFMDTIKVSLQKMDL